MTTATYPGPRRSRPREALGPVRDLNRRLTAWTFRHPWKWGVLEGILVGTGVGVANGLHDGVPQGLAVGISVGAFCAALEGVVTRAKASGAWRQPYKPGPIVRGCRLLLVGVLVVIVAIVAIVLAASLAGSAPVLVWLVVAVLLASAVGSALAFARRRGEG
jgi:hypothetical protein